MQAKTCPHPRKTNSNWQKLTPIIFAHPLLPGQPLTIYCQVYTYIPNGYGTPEPYIRYHVPVYDILEVMDEIELVESGDIPDIPDPRPTCELPLPTSLRMLLRSQNGW